MARQMVAAGSTASVGQSSPTPSQLSTRSQPPALARQTAELLASVGHAAPVPVHSSTTSQTPADERQTVPELSFTSAGQSSVDPSHASATSHTPADERQTVPELTFVSAGQAAPEPVQFSATSQTPPDERQTSAHIERQIQELRGQSRARLAQSTVAFMLYEYRSLDDDELQQYADFLGSDAGRWYTATMSKAMNRTVAVAAQRAASDVIRAIPPPRWSGGAAASPRY